MTHTWLASFGSIAAVGVESTGSFGAALTRSLVERGCRVIEINQPHPHLRARRGKNDAIDAEAAARKVLSGKATAAATDTTGSLEAIRQLSVARNSAVEARAAALCPLGDLLVTAPAALRHQLDGRRTLEAKAVVCARLRPDTDRLADPAPAAHTALRSLGRRIALLGAEATELERQLDGLVAAAAPSTVSRLGCGTHHTAALLVAAGENIDRSGSAEPTSPPSQPALDIYRNVSEDVRWASRGRLPVFRRRLLCRLAWRATCEHSGDARYVYTSC